MAIVPCARRPWETRSSGPRSPLRRGRSSSGQLHPLATRTGELGPPLCPSCRWTRACLRALTSSSMASGSRIRETPAASWSYPGAGRRHGLLDLAMARSSAGRSRRQGFKPPCLETRRRRLPSDGGGGNERVRTWAAATKSRRQGDRRWGGEESFLCRGGFFLRGKWK